MARSSRNQVRRAATAVVSTALLAVTAACGSDPVEEESASDPKGSTSSTSEPTPRESTEEPDARSSPEARTRIRAALKRWIAADTGEFTQHVSFGDTGKQTFSGTYGLSTQTMTGTQRTKADGEYYVFEFVAVEDVTYMQAREWDEPIDGCWLRMTTNEVADATGLPTSPSGTGGLPGNVIALSYARGTAIDRVDENTLYGTVDLPTAATLFGSGMLRLIEDPRAKAGVPAEFTLDDNGDIAGYAVHGADLVDRMDDLGWLDSLSDEDREALETFEADVEYSRLGSTDVNATPPAPDLQMSGDEMESRDGCPAVR